MNSIDVQTPTAYQISAGQLILPRKFYLRNQDLLQGEFACVAFGKRIENRKLDQSYRVRIPFMKDHMREGDRAAVRLEQDGSGCVLYVDLVDANEGSL